MSSQSSFGLTLRRMRQHRGVSLDTIASRTKVSVDLWEDMERNDFSRWPSGISARAWLRAYAELVGVDPDETVNDFCRWFPQGDRRAESVVREHAAMVGHQLAWDDDLPDGGDRRTSAKTQLDRIRAAQARHIRMIAAAGDLCAVILLAVASSLFLPIRIWIALGLTAGLYHAISLSFLGCTPAVWAIDTYVSAHPRLQQRGEVLAFRRLDRPANDASR